MRIRKQASKLLGWAYHSQFATSSSPPPSEAHEGEVRCELNISPWDAVNSPYYTISKEDLEAANDSSEMTAGAVAGEDHFHAKEDEEKKEESENKTEEKETRPMDVMRCKKTDGKRWRCKLAAKLPHSLCNYHLTQLRSYRTRFETQISGDHPKKAFFAMDRDGTASSYYYYYSVLGPWWGKRRGLINGNEGGSGGCNDGLELECSREDGNGDGKMEEEGVGVGEEEGGGGSCFEVKYCMKKKRKVSKKKKRGRKAVKSRSIKSLM